MYEDAIKLRNFVASTLFMLGSRLSLGRFSKSLEDKLSQATQLKGKSLAIYLLS